MTLGEKIRKYRTMHDKTQRQLGLDIGFSRSAADVRVNQYENDKVVPKEDVLERIANVLDIDRSAISSIDLHYDIDLIRALFLLEEQYGMKIERTPEQTALLFDNRREGNEQMNSLLYAWSSQRKHIYASSDTISESDQRRYDLWKSRFPKDLFSYMDEEYTSLMEVYKPMVQSLSRKKSSRITKVSEFIVHIRTMIEQGIHVSARDELFGRGDGGLTLTLLLSELKDAAKKERQQAFATFLNDLDSFEKYGMEIRHSFSLDEAGVHVSYTLRLSCLMALSNTINKAEYYITGTEHSDWDVKVFEAEYRECLRNYEIDIQNELKKRSSGKRTS